MVLAMFWPLSLGFLLTGVLRTSRKGLALASAISRLSPLGYLRAVALGAVSSSCSYAANSLAKNLIDLGADPVLGVVFMFAATNLVAEMVLVLLSLLPWQFLAGEVVAGLLVTALLATTGPLVKPRLRRREAGGKEGTSASPPACHDDTHNGAPWAAPARIREVMVVAWGEFRMVARELAIGLVAGALMMAFASRPVLHHLFPVASSGQIAAAALGPVVASLAMLCSEANVPFAAGLWRIGLPFSGVIAFLLGDLVILPVLLMYKRYWGTKEAARLALWFAGCIFAASAVTGILFSHAAILPASYAGPSSHATSLPLLVNASADLLVVIGLAVVAYLAKGEGGGGDLVEDPVCHMVLKRHEAAATLEVQGHPHYFCSHHCMAAFEARMSRRQGSKE
jgi:uncharacterized membrane protein YraQ (UPF0718 family)/YHS domain-containing protein